MIIFIEPFDLFLALKSAFYFPRGFSVGLSAISGKVSNSQVIGCSGIAGILVA